MRFSTSALVLGTLAAGTVSAASIAHEGFAGKRHNHAARHVELMKKAAEVVEVEKRAASFLNTADAARLTSMGAQTGTNNVAANGLMPWIGADGKFTNEFTNVSGEDLVLAVWGPAGSWVNAVKPQITVSIPKNTSQTISFPVGWSGAWAPVYGSTTMINGQIFETWGEGTFAPPYSVVDVSREVNMAGRSMSIVGPQCTTDMNTCVFKCGDSSAKQCLTGYVLENCATGSQKGANMGVDYLGAPSGGCGGMGSSAALKTTLG